MQHSIVAEKNGRLYVVPVLFASAWEGRVMRFVKNSDNEEIVVGFLVASTHNELSGKRIWYATTVKQQTYIVDNQLNLADSVGILYSNAFPRYAPSIYE